MIVESNLKAAEIAQEIKKQMDVINDMKLFEPEQNISMDVDIPISNHSVQRRKTLKQLISEI